MPGNPNQSNQPQPTIQQVNDAARALLISQGVDATQQIFQTSGATFTAGSNIINVPVRNVGFIKGFLVEITGTATPATAAIKLSPFGLSNLLSNVTFTDLSNNVRINTAGWHLTMVNTAKRQWVYGAALTSDTPLGFGSNFGVITPAATINGASTAFNYRMFFYVPLAYSNDDLRGGIYANVVNATMNLQLTLNTGFFASHTQDPTLAVFVDNTSTTASVAMSNTVVTVYQQYIDQVPIGKNGPVLPPIDISYIYELKNTTLSAVVANQPFAIPFANFRDFMSTTFIYDQGATPWLQGYLPGGGAALAAGSEITTVALQAANFTNIISLDPFALTLRARAIIGDDPPFGTYYLDSRNHPISTVQYGNQQINVTPNIAPAGASFLVGFEDFALINQVTGAGSLPSS